MFCISPRLSRLNGIDLIDCANANAKYGLTFTAKQCGYANDLQTFLDALQEACNHMGISFHDFDEFSTGKPNDERKNIEISPESSSII